MKNWYSLFSFIGAGSYSLLIIFICIEFTIGCKPKASQQAVLTHAASQKKADGLIAKAEGYLSTRPDSLSLVADQLLALGSNLRNDSIVVRAERYKAKALWNLGNHPEAMNEAVRALRHAETRHVRSEIPEIYAIIGHLHKEKKNYDMAFDAVNKGLLAATEIHDTASIIYLNRLEAMFTQGLGATRKDTSLIIKSLNMHLEGVKLAETSDKFERSRISYYNNIGQAYMKLHEGSKALYYVNKAIGLGIKHNQQYSLTFSYNWLAQIYADNGDRENAIKYAQKALQITKDLKYSFREMEVNDHFHEILNQLNDYKGALETYTRYSELRDSLRILENVRQVGELQIKYEAEKKDKQITDLGNLNKSLVKQTAGIWSILGVFLFLMVGILYQFRVNLRKNESLAVQNTMINAQAEKMQVLMNELHHRVKNNLQIVSNLLSLQASRVADEDSKSIIRAGQQRIEAMSLIHKSLYHYDEVNKVNMNEYLSELVGSIMQTFGIDHQKLKLTIICDTAELDIDIAMPLGLIINEWVTNAFKHAYHNIQDPELMLTMHGNQVLNLQISDNGTGMDLNIWNQPKSSFGVKLVKVLVRQLNGECRVYLEDGTKLELKIPLNQLELSS